MIWNFISVLALAGAVVSAAHSRTRRDGGSSQESGSGLPTVDLEYAVHQATINETGNYYNFSNIRYGAAPVGDLRFKASIPPTTINRTLNDGQQGSVCAQAAPAWPNTSIKLFNKPTALEAELAIYNAEVNAFTSKLTMDSTIIQKPNTRESEDCLFLDVIVPKSTFHDESRKNPAPVLVWLYDGGYNFGHKSSAGNPATLIAQSQVDGGEGVIFVAINYRLGLFGWLSGSTFSQQGGVPNAGLYDQRLALEWIRENIYRFGGDPTRVTVIGSSAGGGSIMHQITAYGGSQGPAPFSQAIIQSPAFPPVPGDAQQVATYQSLISQAQSLISADIKDVASLRALDFETLANLNRIVVARSAPYGSFTFGPVVDGTFVPKLPGVLLSEGKFDARVNVMVGQNFYDAYMSTPPFFLTEDHLAAHVADMLPDASNETISYMLSTLYPAVYNGALPYKTLFGRAMLINSELNFACNTQFLNVAFQNKTYAYYFTVPHAIHGTDVAYTFFNGDTTASNNDLPVQPAIATEIQRYITNFAMSRAGNPNGRGVSFFPQRQNNATALFIELDKVGVETDPVANDRCAWLMKGSYV